MKMCKTSKKPLAGTRSFGDEAGFRRIYGVQTICYHIAGRCFTSDSIFLRALNEGLLQASAKAKPTP